MWILGGCQSLPSDNAAETPDAHLVPAFNPLPTVGEIAAAAEKIERQRAPAPTPVVEPLPPTDLWQRIRRDLTWRDMEHARIHKARKHLLNQYGLLDLYSQRAEIYLFYIVEEVEKRGLPIELALLPFVESTMDPFAYSPRRAAGLWQIMSATGKQLGLRQDWWYDGRRDLRDSTDAALNYLEALHRAFDGDWLLALAAYNSGKVRVNRALRSNARNGRATDYWSLRLPRETRHYVPRLIALSQIIAEPERYGVYLPPVANRPAFEIANTSGQLELLRASEIAGMELKALRALNPGQLRWATAPNTNDELLLPVGKAEAFNSKVAALADHERVSWEHYKIERGDSLIHIAKRFNTRVQLLRQVNGIRGSRIRAGDTLMIPRGSGWQDSLAMAKHGGAKPQGYRVRRGDSLYRIAGKFNVSINDIVAWNSLDPRAYLRPGQKLTLYLPGG